MTSDFYEILRARIPLLPDISASSRANLYASYRSNLEAYLVEADASVPAVEKVRLRLLLDVAIKRIEAEFALAKDRDGRPAPDWALPAEDHGHPGGGAQADAAGVDAGSSAADQLPETVADSANGTYGQPAGADDEQLLDNWDDRVTYHALVHQAPNMPLKTFARFSRTIYALLLHTMKTTAGQERPAYLWLAIEPIIQVGLVVSLYWLFGRSFVYSMPAITFAIIGVGGWLMFRTTLLRLAPGLGREFALCFFPGVQRLHVYLSKAIFFGVSYLMATIVMLSAVAYFEVEPIDVRDPVGFLAYWCLLGVFSLGFALVMNYVFFLIPAIQRLMLVIMRGIYLFSSVVVVTEQLPGEDKQYFLWNPLLHGMQLLRSSFFHEYTSDDASAGYFISWTAAMLLLGVLCERIQRRRDITP